MGSASNYFDAADAISVDFPNVRQVDTKPSASGFSSGNIIYDRTEKKFYETDGTTWTQISGATIASIPIQDLTNVTITSVSSNEILSYNGSVWVNETFDEAGLISASTVSTSATSGSIPRANSDGELEYVPTDLPRVTSVANLEALTSGRYNLVYLDSGGRSGYFKWDASNLSTQVTNDPGQGIYIAPSSDATGASGAWVRDYEGGEVNVKWFGAVGDGATNDATAFNNAINFFDDGGTVFVPSVTNGYRIDSTINMQESVHLKGESIPAPRDYIIGNLAGSVIKPTGDISNAIRIEGHRGCKLEKLIIDMDGVTAQTQSGTVSGSITNMTQTNPVVVTSNGHGLSDGDVVYISSVTGMTDVNDKYFVVLNAATNTFELRGTDGTGFGAYSANGDWLLKPTGILAESVWYTTLEDVHVVTLPVNDSIGIAWIGALSTPQWNTQLNVSVQRNAGAAKIGTAHLVQGQPNSAAPPRANQCSCINLRAYNCGDGILFDEAGAGWTFLNGTFEDNNRNGVTVTNNTTEGYPYFLGGEIANNGSWGISGLAISVNTTMTSNGSGPTVNGAVRDRLLSSGERSSNGIMQLLDGARIGDSSTSVMDAYDVQSFTPVIVGSVTAGTNAYSTQDGLAIRVGDQVTAIFRVVLDGTAGALDSTGTLRIQGLPWNPGGNNNVGFHAGGVLSEQKNFTLSNPGPVILRTVGGNGVQMQYVDSSSDTQVVTNTEGADNLEFRGSITYVVS